MKKRKRLFLFLALIAAASFVVGCNSNGNNDSTFLTYKDPNAENLALYFSFDEEGDKVYDSYGEDYPVEYVFNDAKFKKSEYAKRVSRSAINGNALVFDGYSNYIEMPGRRLGLSGKQLTIDVFVCPRVFEWDGPYEWQNNRENLQAIVAQIDNNGVGFILGMHKYGDWSFQFSTADKIVRVKSTEGKELSRYQWNHLTCVYNGEEGYAAIYLNGVLVNNSFPYMPTVKMKKRTVGLITVCLLTMSLTVHGCNSCLTLRRASPLPKKSFTM